MGLRGLSVVWSRLGPSQAVWGRQELPGGRLTPFGAVVNRLGPFCIYAQRASEPSNSFWEIESRQGPSGTVCGAKPVWAVGGCLGPSGTVWSRHGGVWGFRGRFSAVWGRLGPSRSVGGRLGPSGAAMGPSGAVLGRREPSGALWGRLGPFGTFEIENKTPTLYAQRAAHALGFLFFQ